MKARRAEDIAREFEQASGYRVAADQHGLLVTEDAGRTSYFRNEENFFRFIETVTWAPNHD